MGLHLENILITKGVQPDLGRTPNSSKLLAIGLVIFPPSKLFLVNISYIFCIEQRYILRVSLKTLPMPSELVHFLWRTLALTVNGGGDQEELPLLPLQSLQPRKIFDRS